MRDDQTPDAHDSVQIHFKTRRGNQTCTVSRDVQEIDLHFRQIRRIDLTPLSSCSNLQVVDLRFNQLRNLDLMPLSSCGSLSELYLGHNRLQSIDLMPLSSCSSLSELYLGYNQLQSVDLTPLSSCTSLQTLEFSGNKLQSIDLTPLSSCSSLETLYTGDNPLKSVTCAIGRGTLQLMAPQLVWGVRSRAKASKKQVPSRTDLAALSRIVDKLWHGPDSSERWRAHAVVQDVLSRMGLGWLGMVDGDPSIIMNSLGDIDDSQRITEVIIEMLCRAIDEGSSALGLDVERTADYGALAVRLPKILQARQEEVKSLRVKTTAKSADLRPLWLTEFGFRVLSSLGLATKCSHDELKKVQESLSGLGVQLDLTTEKTRTSERVSESMSNYIWRLAGFRARETKRKRR